MKILKGVAKTPRRVLLYGPHGVGKGTWASKAPHPIFLDIEGGLDDINCERTERIGSLEQVSEALLFLQTEDHDYKTVVIDSVDWLEQLMHQKVAMDEGVKSIGDIGYGKGYARCVPMWRWVISQLEQLRDNRKMGVVLLGHSKVERYESPETDSYDRYSVDLHKSTSSMVQEWCDEVLFATFRVYTKQQSEGFNRKRNVAVGGKERFVRTSESASCLAKNRANLPEEMPLDWQAYQDAVASHYSESKAGNIEGIVVEGTSKVVDQEIEAMKEVF